MNKMQFQKRLSLPIVYLILLGLYGVFYIGKTLSPSSYGIVLEQIKAKGEGLVFGVPRIIRGDEWWSLTPLAQISVNNNFERYNKTSPYKEDLRASYALPLKDWGLIFKPTMWGYHLLPPEYAFSLYYFLIMALFLIGFAVLFFKLGVSNITGIGLSILLYFSSFVQTWWTMLGPTLAIFPWIYLCIIWNKPLKLKLPIFYYLTTWMMFANFYPVIFYTFAFAMLFFLLAFHRSFFTLKNVILFSICGLIAVGTYLFYIRDLIEPLSNTIYPGQRRSSGGDIGLIHWLSLFFPHLSISGIAGGVFYNETGLPYNICEMSTASSYLLLLIMIFGKWKEWIRNISKEEKRRLIILFIGFTFVTIWQLLPVPSEIARLIMLDRVAGGRWFFTSGFLLIGIAIIILKRIEFEFNLIRQFAFVFTILAVTLLACKYHASANPIFETLLSLVSFGVFVFLRDFLKVDNKS
jgi:hypothetical protein